MSIRPLTARLVALAVAGAVTFGAAGPAFAQPAGRRPCEAMAGPDGCARGAVVASCCCADARRATPAERPAPAGGAPSSAFAQADTGWVPVLVPIPLSATLAPAHGYQSVPLHTLHSALLI